MGASGLPREKSSDMAAVLMTGRDGRTALLAFTSTASLDRWAQSYAGGEARPVPVPARQAASAALQDKAAALLVDVAGPVLFVVEGEDLRSLAAGHRLVRLEERWAWVQSAARRRRGWMCNRGASLVPLCLTDQLCPQGRG